jgi:3-phosphoshikimate 1-carboxyvinyltransferase
MIGGTPPRFAPSVRIGRSGPVRAIVRVPGSKSITNRALIAAALAEGPSTLESASFSDDSRLLVEALELLGFEVAADPAARRLSLSGTGGRVPRAQADLSLGNAGSSLRFVTSMLCLGRGSYRIDGTARMRERPIGDLVDGLEQLGARVTYLGRPGCPPLRIDATGLAGGAISVGGSTSSQFVSSILLSAPAAAAPIRLSVTGGQVSAPYVAMTLAVMQAFGVDVTRSGASTYEVPCRRYRGCRYPVAGDAASANYLLALAAATGGEVTVAGIDPAVPQAESAFVDVLAAMGCAASRQGDAVTVRGGPLRGVDVDMNAMPDSVQTLAPLALLAAGPTRIRNVANLRVKETDRLAALGTELRRFGARVEVTADGLAIEPPSRPAPAAVETYEDHRMAMGFAVLGAAVGDIVIRQPAVVTKSYPEFFEELGRLGVGLTPEPAA